MVPPSLLEAAGTPIRRARVRLLHLVAGTDVLGARVAADGHQVAAFGLLVIGWVGWLALG